MMRVLHVCSEVYPYLKTGGLADVAAGLPTAQARLGCEARLLVPGFPALLAGLRDARTLAELPPRFGASSVRLLAGKLLDLDAYVIEAPGLYDRPGNPYADAYHQAYGDNHRRFALLGWVGARLAQGLDDAWRPDVLHGHDWHAGLAPAYLRAWGVQGVRSVITVHNLAYQGVFPAQCFGELDLPGQFFGMHGVEFNGSVSFLKAGLYYADKITTVSPTYAREIQDAEQGCGLQGLLRGRAADLHGILNGVDYAVWHPRVDAHVAAHYDADDLRGKRDCKRALQSECGLAVRDDAPLFGVVSRLTDQKGLNLVLDGVQDIIERGGQLAMLGSGDAWLEHAFREAAARHPQSVAVQLGYDEAKAHRIIAGSDLILVPSRFEPCGLTQLYGLAYGTVPLVRRVGGLADSVADRSPENLAAGTATGIVFNDFDAHAFRWAVGEAFRLHGQPQAWRKIQQQGMRQAFSWEVAARSMMAVYQD
ncbi:starch synthase [Noviherbaspirillum humi]|uniref:Glycogen synthase n=1 Tax=Noviherbaspirillum humi TaxID=1688639 RepID=A0A239FC89_9BURK|nr:glycogen synthase GlgA [Noviherbaspirillum humi]SNS54447.1 starch synthase [Noviherbaspirillum humi]